MKRESITVLFPTKFAALLAHLPPAGPPAGHDEHHHRLIRLVPLGPPVDDDVRRHEDMAADDDATVRLLMGLNSRLNT